MADSGAESSLGDVGPESGPEEPAPDSGARVLSYLGPDAAAYADFVPLPPSIPTSCQDAAVPAPLLRPGCPEVPALIDCTIEGTTCLYPAAGEVGCYDPWVCKYGLLSPMARQCGGDMAGRVENPAACPPSLPVLDTPCEPQALECGYGACALGGGPEARIVCACGRWADPGSGCPID